MNNEQAERVSKARALMILDHPFWGTLAARMPCIQDASVPTAATNGKQIRYNAEYLAKQTDRQAMGLMAHETMHPANGHTWRRGDREPGLWNEACDYAINPLLLESGFDLPEGALVDQRFAGMAAEQIYNTLQQEKPPESGSGKGRPGPGKGQPQGQPEPGDGEGDDEGSSDGSDEGSGNPGPADPGKCGAVEDSPPEEQAQQEAEWKVAVAQAAMAARSAGKLPGNLQRLVDELLNPKIPWHVLLRDFVEQSAKNDYNWSRPNRRYTQSGFILPGLVSEELPAIVIAIDTSGSIRPQELDQFAAEVSAVLGAYDTTIHVVFCDARVTHVQEVTRADLPLKLKPLGGGGTDFRPVFDYVERQGLEPACLIYLTDGFGSFPINPPQYSVLWALVNNANDQIPFGEVVHIQQ